MSSEDSYKSRRMAKKKKKRSRTRSPYPTNERFEFYSN